MKPLALHPSARRELRQAIDFYNAQEEGLGDEFDYAVRGAFARIRERPLLGTPVEADAPRVLITQFRYSII